MLHDSTGVMLSRVLGLLILSSLCSAILPNATSNESSGEDPYTYYMPSTDQKELSNSTEPYEGMDHWPDMARSGHTEPQWPPYFNMSNQHRMTESEFQYASETAICAILSDKPISELPSFCICSRCKGAMGPKGDPGDRGLPGPPGSPGRRGMMGFPGAQGFTGRQGIKGQKGDLGGKGLPGAVGFTGMKGGRGIKGEKGEGGLEGPPGSQGPQGETGTCPASCESVQGPPGLPGVPGPAGTRGMPGVQGPKGLKGMMGNKGHEGRPGDPGMHGMKGDQGEQGICECTDGADGADGSPGAKGDKGYKGDTGAQGVQGPMGLKGTEGEAGLMGHPGPCSPVIQSAFTASINESFPRANWPVNFPSIIINLHGHFNPNIGIYMAPVNGTYVFSFNLAVAGRPLAVGLFYGYLRFQQFISTPVLKVTETSDHSTISQTATLHLNMGDMVWLQVKNNITNGIYTGIESSSTFTGYLLYPDSCELPRGRNFEQKMDFNENDFSWDSNANTTATTTAPPP